MPRNRFEGYYKQDGEECHMEFKSLKLKEDSITGSGSDEIGAFNIEGTIEGKGIEFNK